MSQREVQSGHWSHGQATLFTTHIWSGQSSNDKMGMVIVSSNLTHTKYSIFVFMQYIFQYLKEHFPLVKTVNVFSDGPSSQFKQKYLFSNLSTWQEEFDIELKWNFFATSHGKGVVDGIGGSVKRAVWRHVRSEQVHVSNAQQYSDVARERCPQIHVHYISKEDIDRHQDFLNKKWENTVTIPGTHKIHFIRPASDKHKVVIAETSDDKELKIVRIRKPNVPEVSSDEDEASNGSQTDSQNTKPSIGQWVLVSYDHKDYPGEVTAVEDGDIEVNVMHKSGGAWKWPVKADKIFYPAESIVKRLNPPRAAGSRGQFVFDEFF